jgi:hypothetical protein
MRIDYSGDGTVGAATSVTGLGTWAEMRRLLRLRTSLRRNGYRLPLPGHWTLTVDELVMSTVTYTRAVYRKTIDEIHTLLLTMESPEAAADRAHLLTLDPHETHLAVVKTPLSKHPRQYPLCPTRPPRPRPDANLRGTPPDVCHRAALRAAASDLPGGGRRGIEQITTRPRVAAGG